MRFQFRLVPTLMVVPSLILIFGLSAWQVQRMAWKEDLISKMMERVEEAPTILPSSGLNEENDEFKPFVVRGTFDHENEIYMINRSLNGNAGRHVFTPLIRSDGQGTIMVNRGWVPFEDHLPTNRMAGQYEGQVNVSGLLRYSKGKNAFTPDNETEKNIWFHIDLAEMGRVIGQDVADFYIMSDDDKVEGGFPIGKQWNLDIRNNHLQYAITWFCLGISLLVIFLIFSRRKEDEGE